MLIKNLRDRKVSGSSKNNLFIGFVQSKMQYESSFQMIVDLSYLKKKNIGVFLANWFINSYEFIELDTY